MLEVITAFIGVNEGYDFSKPLVNKAWQAARIVRKNIARDLDKFAAYPALAVYHTSWGCPDGGEPCSILVSNAREADALNQVEILQKLLCQNTVTFVSSDSANSCNTEGFFVELVNVSMQDLAKSWQNYATWIYDNSDTQFYVSAGFYQREDDAVFIQGEANPEYVDNIDEWKGIVERICRELSQKFDIEISPQFRDVNLKYLKLEKQEQQGSTIC